ncbi:MAG: hypothetical protein NWE89_02645 [Candidatus Bathyarchaeota archaeon]|nr:hypothetical protein [Candidatus Bathyarchaeota archaeon]
MKAIVFHSKINPNDLEQILSRHSGLEGFIFNIEKLEDTLFRISLSREIKGSYNHGILLLDFNESDSWVVYTNKGSYYVKHVVESFFDKLYPLISRIYFNINQMKKFVNVIKDEYEGRSTFTSFTIHRVKKQWKLSDRQKKGGTLILYEENADDELKKISKDYYLTINRLNFNIVDSNDILLLKSNIYRNGRCSLSYGDFNRFYYNVVLKIIEYGREWRSFYAKRERSVFEKDIFLNPFSILYSNDFSIHEIKKLSKQISNKYSCAIIHNGNPYFVANLSDYEEGSSYGITAIGDIITITPITRGTDVASWKLTETIQQILGDGIVRDVRMI